MNKKKKSPLVGEIHWRSDRLPAPVFLGFPFDSAGKKSTHNVGDLCSAPGLGRYPGQGKGYPFQYSDLENSMDCIVHGFAKSQTFIFRNKKRERGGNTQLNIIGNERGAIIIDTKSTKRKMRKLYNNLYPVILKA